MEDAASRGKSLAFYPNEIQKQRMTKQVVSSDNLALTRKVNCR